MKKIISLVLTAMMASGMIVGCGNEENESSNAGGKNTENNSSNTDNDSEESDEKEPIVYRTTGGKTATLNPHEWTSSSESSTMSYIYGNMLELMVNEEGDNFEYVPHFATDLPTRSEDGLTWTFEVKDGLEWPDGTAINAGSFEYSYKMLLDPKLKNYRAFYFFDNSLKITNAEKYYNGECEWEDVGIKSEGNKLIISLDNPVPEMDFLMSFTGGSYTSPVKEDLYEACFNEDRTENDYGTTLEKTPSNGPYVLTEWVRDQKKTYERNEKSDLGNKYYTPDVITVRVVEDASTRLSLFESEETDYIGVSGENYEKYEEDPRIVFTESASLTTMNINTKSETNPILGNVDFRKSLFYGMDRTKIAEELYKTAIPAPFFVPGSRFVKQGLRYRDTEEAQAIVPENNGYDEAKALEHFDKAYEANGNKKVEVELVYFDTNDSMKKMAEYLEASYEELFGEDRIDIMLKAMPSKAAYDNTKKGDYEMTFVSMQGWRFNPFTSLGIYTSESGMKYDTMNNAEYDELYEKMMSAELILNEDERVKVLAQLEEILFEQCPVIPTIETKSASMYSDRITLKTGGQYLPGVGFGVLQSEFND